MTENSSSISSQPNPVPLAEQQRGASSPKKLVLTAIKYAVCIAAIVFVVIALKKNLKDFDWKSFHPHIGILFAAAASIGAVTVTQIIAYRLLLAAYGPKLTWPQAATLSWVPGLAKYIPGKVVAIGGTVYLLRRYKIPAAVALSVTLMGDAVAVLTGLSVGAPMLLTPEARAHLPGGVIWCVLMIAGGLIALYPPVFTKLVNVALRKMKRAELNATPKLHYYLLPILAGFAQWICWGVALWFTARSIGPVDVHAIPRFIVIAALANTIAYLVIFAPGGIGFRELFLFLGLDPIIGHANAAIVVVAIRIIQTVVEIVLAGLGVLILKRMGEE
jgi:hypothetical protein